MDHIFALLTGPEVLTALMGLFGAILTFVIGRAAAAFTLATGIQIEAKHREALHMAIQSGVESAIRHGLAEGGQTFNAHIVQHVRESVPDAIKRLSPLPDVMDRIIQRYTLEAMARFGKR